MRDSDNDSHSSVFDVVKVFSKLYNAIYCSREVDSATESPTVAAEEGENQTKPQNQAEFDLEPVEVKVGWFEAVRDDKVDRVKELLATAVDVNDKDEHGWSGLHIASWNNYTEILSLLLEAGAKVNEPGPGGCSPLALAAQQGHSQITQQLLAASCDVNLTADLGDNHNVTALHLAAQHGHTDVVRILVSTGATVNAAMTVRGIHGVTALHLAVQNEHLDIMDVLIGAGCDVHSSTEGSTKQEQEVDRGEDESAC